MPVSNIVFFVSAKYARRKIATITTMLMIIIPSHADTRPKKIRFNAIKKSINTIDTKSTGARYEMNFFKIFTNASFAITIYQTNIFQRPFKFSLLQLCFHRYHPWDSWN